MIKNKRNIFNLITIIYILLTLIEFIIYMFSKNNLFGVFYIILNLITIFFLVPVAYNNNKYYSKARISKLIIILLLGLFNTILLPIIVTNTMHYIDSSQEYIKKIFVIRIILKNILHLLLLGILLLEFKLETVLPKTKKTTKK